MKTIETISAVVVAMMAGSATLELATGLPLPFAMLGAVAAVTLAFAVTVLLGALVRPARAPLSIARASGRVALSPRPITRPSRVAA